MAAVLEPPVRRGPNNPRITSIWRLLCGTVRELGSDREAGKRLINLLETPSKLQFRHERGNDVKHEWGSRYPKLVTSNQPCETRIDSDEAAPGCSGMTYYVKRCMSEALARPYPYDMPEPRSNEAVYMPAASAWISIAVRNMYESRRGGESGFDLPIWESWEKSFGEVAASDEANGEAQEIALRAKDEMGIIQRRVDL
ncbi:hypothetical protein DL764_001873 [Monosporascus ibericus]|uniref:Uncharacterized protein n=1 Tax=Monosporascus ibericus TaxID=155417 RepID=A0A4Q4TMS7_9PEZI|nr:hypothetical protein DL764_001873 [Monosporascus ibericus]